MNLTTTFSIPAASVSMNHRSRVLTMGSCFAASMGSRLSKLPLEVMTQPLGTLFHPFAITRAISGEVSEDLYEHGGYFLHPDYHSIFTATSSADLLEEIRSVANEASTFVASSDFLILTWGTSFSYFDKRLNKTVANCHKMPADRFEKRLSTVDEIVSNFCSLLSTLPSTTQVVLTVSPVRHTKDGMQENQVSKSTLRVAADIVSKQFENVHYFPAYEIMLDELRDYRFYETDMIHPNQQAQDYIWERFVSTYFDPELQTITKRWDSIYRTLAHRPHPSKLVDHRRVLEVLLAELNAEKYQEIDTRKIAEYVAHEIKNTYI
ncbi:GSCFA domain-containing protein [Aquirufa lenticrescens]